MLWRRQCGVFISKKVFLARVADSKFPVLALNLSDLEMDELVLKPYVVIDRGGYKLGIMGMAYQWTAKTGERSLTEGWSFGLREKRGSEFCKGIERKAQGGFSYPALSHGQGP